MGRTCYDCPMWEAADGAAWWTGTCRESGLKIGHRQPDCGDGMGGYSKDFKALGNGDAWEGRRLLGLIAERLDYARLEHPTFAEGAYQALGVIHGEYAEMEQAVEKLEGREREKDEALDVAVTALRFYLGEHLTKE